MARVIGAEGGLQLAEKGGRTLARQPEGVARGVAQHLNGSLAARLAAVPSVERNQAEVVVRFKLHLIVGQAERGGWGGVVKTLRNVTKFYEVLRVMCCMLHVACCMLHVACCFLFAVCCSIGINVLLYCSLPICAARSRPYPRGEVSSASSRARVKSTLAAV